MCMIKLISKSIYSQDSMYRLYIINMLYNITYSIHRKVNTVYNTRHCDPPEVISHLTSTSHPRFRCRYRGLEGFLQVVDRIVEGF